MDGEGDFTSNVRLYNSPISQFFFSCILKCDRVGEETMDDGKAFQQLIQ